MKTLWILAAAATFAACHNRSSDETGAAPDRGDSTMTTIDTTTPAPNPSGFGLRHHHGCADRPERYDGCAGAYDGIDTTSTTTPPAEQPYDTTSTAVPSPSVDSTAPAAPSTGVDTTTNPSDAGMQPDTSMAAPTTTDSTQR